MALASVHGRRGVGLAIMVAALGGRVLLPLHFPPGAFAYPRLRRWGYNPWQDRGRKPLEAILVAV